ncbi:ABC transporter ATP-binding protein [Curvibacter sp. PAE-UM]|uniref:cyanophycin metabolism-associated ABC transporter n=1 Tax=Curvibacter sp. PAE-UM TaxID=1714344 RepID=UPI0009EA90D8|nr:ABC transporter ATP-binding protein [Curvibacter sp. PAE-UM]
MTRSTPSAALLSFSDVPAEWLAEIRTQLHPDENVQAVLEVDLDTRLQFGRGLLVATERRLLARAPGQSAWQAWAYHPTLKLNQHDHAGVGHLELLDGQGRLAHWCYTLGQNLQAVRLAEQVGHQLNSLSTGQPVPVPVGHECPICKASLDPGQDECPICAKVIHTPPSTWTLLRLWRFAKPYKGQLLLGFVLTLLGTAASLVPPYLTMPLMDEVLVPLEAGKQVDPMLVVLYLSGLLGAAVVAWGLTWAKTYILALVSERIGADLRTTTYDHLMRLSLEYFGGKRTGDLMARIGSETDRICVFLSLHLLDFFTDLIMLLMTAAILFSINPWLALATLIPLPIIMWMIHAVRHRLKTGFEKIDRVWSEVTSVLADTIPGIRVVKAFAQENRESARFHEANRQNLQVNDRINKIWALFAPSISFLTEVGLLVVWGVGVWLIAKGETSVGVLTAFIAYISRFYGRLDSMSRIVSWTEHSASATKRIFDILDHVSSVPEPAQPVHLKQVQGRIEVRDVGFRYGNREVNRGINVTIEPGQMVGLVGHSGSGKSTLVNLICRFYDVTEGSIRIDGVDIRSLPVAEYRRNIGLVLQEPFLFFGTIAENIAYGKPDATREQIVAAARAAHAHEFILRLPQGYDSIVGERGQGLSGGERQRISIARALLIDPRILILDEATASVDSETEKEIQKALDNLVQGRTTIAIAHRLSTLQRADRLIVLDRGQVVEEGTHDELMARQGAYYNLYQAQARNVDTDMDDAEAEVNPERKDDAK